MSKRRHLVLPKSKVVGKKPTPYSSGNTNGVVPGELAVNIAAGNEFLATINESGTPAVWWSLWEKGYTTSGAAAGTPETDVPVFGAIRNFTGSTASGTLSVAEGAGTMASGYASHAEGYNTTAGEANSHAEGASTIASGAQSHAEGGGTTASGAQSHAEGASTIASGISSHAEGGGTRASGEYSHAEGAGTKAEGINSHAEGAGTKAEGINSHAEGASTIASGVSSHAEGISAITSGRAAHAEGESTTASGSRSHAEGSGTTASGEHSHAEGSGTKAEGTNSHTEGTTTIASGYCSHAEGCLTKAGGVYSHAEGESTIASGSSSHAEGKNTSATTYYTHAEGINTAASGTGAHAEGGGTRASGQYSHAEGSNTIASGDYSHAEGQSTKAIGGQSHAEGNHTIANNSNEHASGIYNKSHSGTAVADWADLQGPTTAATTVAPFSGKTTLFSIGYGTSSASTINAFEVTNQGQVIMNSRKTYVRYAPTGTTSRDDNASYASIADAKYLSTSGVAEYVTLFDLIENMKDNEYVVASAINDLNDRKINISGLTGDWTDDTPDGIISATTLVTGTSANSEARVKVFHKACAGKRYYDSGISYSYAVDPYGHVVSGKQADTKLDITSENIVTNKAIATAIFENEEATAGAFNSLVAKIKQIVADSTDFADFQNRIASGF